MLKHIYSICITFDEINIGENNSVLNEDIKRIVTDNLILEFLFIQAIGT